MVYGPTYGYTYPTSPAAPGKLGPSLRYYPPGLRKVYWLTSIALAKVPTRAELNAGTDLSAEIAGMTGWGIETTPIETPDITSRFTSVLPGSQDMVPTSMTFYISSSETDVRSLLVPWTSGYMVLLWEGDVTGGYMDIFPVWVSARLPDTVITDAGQFQVGFAANGSPALGVPIP